MSEFPDPDFAALRNAQRVRQFGSRLESVEGGVRSGARGLAGEGKGEGLTRGVDLLHQGADEARRAAAQTYANAAAADEAAALADHWSAVAPKDTDIDEADAQVQQASKTLREVSRGKNYAAEMAAAAALKAAQQNAAVLRQQRIQADESYSTGMTALAAKVEQQTAAAASRTFVTDYTSNTNTLGPLKPPARTPGTPSAPRTAAGSAPSPFAPRTPAADDAVAKLMSQAQQPQGQPVTLPGQGQQQPQPQQPHPQAAAAGGAPTGTPTAKPADRKRDSDGTPTGLAAAVGATGASASPLHPIAATPRATNPGYSVKDLVTGTNVTGRPSPQVTLSGGTPSIAPAQAAGTAAAPGQGGVPYGPGAGGMGGAGKGARREAPRIVQGVPEPLEEGIVRGGTVCRGDAPPEERAN